MLSNTTIHLPEKLKQPLRNIFFIYWISIFSKSFIFHKKSTCNNVKIVYSYQDNMQTKRRLNERISNSKVEGIGRACNSRNTNNLP